MHLVRLSVVALCFFATNSALAAVVSDVRNTAHNLSSTPFNEGSDQRTVKATSQTEICVFCHTPHSANTSAKAPLWNRAYSTSTYTLYGSAITIKGNEVKTSSLDATDLGQPSGVGSKLCLSCHDGTLAIGAVNVLNGRTNQTITMTGTGTGGVMASGAGTTTGDTRNIGVDLSNDHPIAFTYNTSLASKDGDLLDPAQHSHIATRSSTNSPAVPLFSEGTKTNQVECISCHDPHIRDTTDENIKFLRLNRFQAVNSTPTEGRFTQSNDIICLACHTKEGWTNSAHANPAVANEQYTTTAANQRDFPASLPVYRAACLNCHDTHTVSGSRRLLREGTDSTTQPKQGGSPAIEETCYQCHSGDGGTLTSQGYGTEVPDIKTDFRSSIRMPITSTDQIAGREVHDIGSRSNSTTGTEGKDFIESESLLGKGNMNNRHVECTDCHNPHRVIKNREFNDNPATHDAAGTHNHTDGHTNIASGVLRGSWGVEPTLYPSNEFMQSVPSTFQVKRGVPPINGSTDVSQSHVTREYQICLKCHSNYGGDYPLNQGAALGITPGSTPAGTNSLYYYTNQAMEFYAPTDHMGEVTRSDTGAYTLTFDCKGDSMCPGELVTNNHRSWHPVMAATGRDKATRRMSLNGAFYSPWDNSVGTQTMYCSDCHGSAVSGYGSSAPDGGENGNAWGPHGSSKNFILKGAWDKYTGTPCGTGDSYESTSSEGSVLEIGDCKNGRPDPRTDQKEDICFKCHNRCNYGFNCGTFGEGLSGFSRQPDSANLHLKHLGRLHRMKCGWCHTAVPHGWKNKALLVNLNDVGPEVGLPPGTIIPTNTDQDGLSQPYFMGPYYNNAILKILVFQQSGKWDPKACGSRIDTEDVGQAWMTKVCNNLP